MAIFLMCIILFETNPINWECRTENEIYNLKEISVKTPIFKRTFIMKYDNKANRFFNSKGKSASVLDIEEAVLRTHLKDCKKYLQIHNLIKIGGGAPNDVIRATYESAMMAGEITNINKDTLLNNMLKEDNS